MKKLIFVLTYKEGPQWCQWYPVANYYNIFPKDCQVIILDNGSQDCMRDWAEQTNNLYHRSDNNLGTTGGYNWFIRVGELLSADRIAVMQADVQILTPKVFDLLFHPQWQPLDFAYFPNMPRNLWNADNTDSDVGQLFSLNPATFLDNDWLCDENYTITHFESIDLWIRMTSEANVAKLRCHNLLEEFSAGAEEDLEFYKIHSITNVIGGEHGRWFKHNYEYFSEKWPQSTSFTPEEAAKHWAEDTKYPEWGSDPWKSPWKGLREFWSPVLLHRRRLRTERNIKVGQLPYPVEWEVNRFYQALESLTPKA